MRAVLRTVTGALLTLLASSLVIFVTLAASPGDAASRLAGSKATAAQIAVIRHANGLDQSLPLRYLHWLEGCLHGDFGTSLQYQQSVASLLAPRIGQTLALVGLTALFILVGGVGAGIMGVLSRPGSTALTVVSGIGVAVPSFVAAALLTQVFALWLGWLPAISTGVGGLRGLILPALALALSWAAYLAQVVHASLREQLGQEHVAIARSRGLGPAGVFRRHVLRNAAPEITTVSGLAVAGLIAGTVVVEQAFGIGGLGSFLVQSVASKDSNVVLAISLLMVAAFILTTTATDLLHRALDPRIRAAKPRERHA
ncbi:ABC transporter permease [Streptomyces phaeochromogenes]|uniref:ABC transporter permease n=1 Tax=Streptomyces phaeochromogenes TaxID=1923 RepID=UPI002DDAD9BD|nr:ABC transporter permease [Streptomyces phaeochromogenes]WRZ34683.1 ABC transporter permease [Streptomyces phaeochromogenes]